MVRRVRLLRSIGNLIGSGMFSGPIAGTLRRNRCEQRYLDLVRKMVLEIEAHPHGYAPGRIEVDGYDEENHPVSTST